MNKLARLAVLAMVALAPVAANAGVIFTGKTVIITPNPSSNRPSSSSPSPSSPAQAAPSQSPIELITQLASMGIPAVCLPTLAESDDAYRNCSRKYARAALVNASAIYMQTYSYFSSSQGYRPNVYGCYATYSGNQATMEVDNGYPTADCDVEARLTLELQLIHSLIEVKAE